MTEVSPRLRRAHLLVAALVAALATLGTGRIASAHTDFDSSTPADGVVVEGPLAEVVVNFTNPASPSGEGFELLDPTGMVRAPSTVDQTDGTSFILTFEPPLAAGTYGLRWKVQAGDAHPIDGSFRFEVTGALPTTSEPSSTSTPAVVVAPPTTVAATMDMDGMEMNGTVHASAADQSLDDFLNAGSTGGDSASAGRVGRTISMLGLIFGVGVLAALIWTVRGPREELVTQLAWIRLAGLAVLTGGLIEYAALSEADPTSSIDMLLTSKPGVAAALKMVGGLAVMLGFHRDAGRIITPTRSLSAAVVTDLPPVSRAKAAPAGRHERPQGEHRWTPTSSAALGLAGYGLVLVSFWFDGHTVSKGPWAIHSIVNFVHLGAAAVWGGGVFAMTSVAWMRRRRSERVGLAAMVVRFSSIATVSLVAVIVAGLVMTWMILDAPGDLFGTQWGRILIAKMAVVAVAAGLGGYNHFRLRPALEQRPDDPVLAKELRISLSVESVVFVAIVVLTAVLVASAT